MEVKKRESRRDVEMASVLQNGLVVLVNDELALQLASDLLF